MSLIDPIVGQQPTVPALDGFGYAAFPDVQPFSQRTASGYQESLESVIYFIQRKLVPYLIQSNPQGVWDANVVALIAAVNSALTAQTAANATAINDALNALANSEITVTDPAIAAVLNQASTATRLWLDAHYAPAELVTGENVAAVVSLLLSHIHALEINVMEFPGVTGMPEDNQTAGVQAAFTKALTASDPINVEHPRFTGVSPTVFFPTGTYTVDTIEIPGAVVVRGTGGGIYAASVLSQRTAGQSVLHFSYDTDGSSNCSVVEDMTFKSQSGTSAGNVAQIISDAPSGNSMYFRRCWFKTPETYAIWIKRGGDIQIDKCTFDVAAFHAIKLGDSSGGTSAGDVRITNNTFFNIALKCVEISYANRVLITDNGAAIGTDYTSSVFVDGARCGDVLIGHNIITDIAYFVRLNADPANPVGGIVINGNDLNGVKNNLLEIIGTDIIYQLTFTNNKGSSQGSGSFASGSAISCPSAALQNSIIAMNSVLAGGTTALFINAPDARTTNNIMGPNTTLRFSLPHNFANPSSNSVAPIQV